MGNGQPRILVTGSRIWRDVPAVFRVLDRIAAGRRVLVVHGGAPGADTHASAWCGHRGMDELIRRPDWDADGRAGGMRRNDRMVLNDGPFEACAAFVTLCPDLVCYLGPEPHGTHGASQCAKAAQDHGIPIVTPRVLAGRE